MLEALTTSMNPSVSSLREKGIKSLRRDRRSPGQAPRRILELHGSTGKLFDLRESGFLFQTNVLPQKQRGDRVHIFDSKMVARPVFGSSNL